MLVEPRWLGSKLSAWCETPRSGREQVAGEEKDCRREGGGGRRKVGGLSGGEPYALSGGEGGAGRQIYCWSMAMVQENLS